MSYEENQKWVLKIQPLAITQHYNKIWSNANVIELDSCADELSKIIDIGGADKMLQFTNGSVAFLGQRFRRWSSKDFDDFTLRAYFKSGNATELQKIRNAIQNGGFIASFYAYGHVNEAEDGFIRFRVLQFRSFTEALISNKIHYTLEKNKYGSYFIAAPFKTIPREYFLYDTTQPQ